MYTTRFPHDSDIIAYSELNPYQRTRCLKVSLLSTNLTDKLVVLKH